MAQTTQKEREASVLDVELEALLAQLEEETASDAAAVETKADETKAEKVEPAEPQETAAEPPKKPRGRKPKAVPEPEPEPAPAPEPVSAPPEQKTREPEPEPPAPAPAPAPPPPVALPEPASAPRTTPNAAPNTASKVLQYHVDVEQFRRDTQITEATLDACMIEQNSLRAYYGAQMAYAEAQLARLKMRADIIEAQLNDRHRKALLATGEKVTEKLIESAVRLDPAWIKIQNLVIEAETIHAINKALVASLADRRDMLIQIGANRREELKGPVRTLANGGGTHAPQHAQHLHS